MCEEGAGGRARFPALDAWRGTALYCMLVYHFLFDLFLFDRLPWGVMFGLPLTALERYIACSFMLCAGVSATLTRSNVRRGLVTLLAGVPVMVVSFLIRTPIWFGVLQCLGLCMLLYAALRRAVDRVPLKIAPVLWLGLFAAAFAVTESVTVPVRWLFWLGLRFPGYVSYDHFPLLPWFFLFLTGTWLGRMLKASPRLRALAGRPAPAALTVPGRHTLWVYLLHQPVLYGALWLAETLRFGSN